jgi:hypothetical protein
MGVVLGTVQYAQASKLVGAAAHLLCLARCSARCYVHLVPK